MMFSPNEPAIGPLSLRVEIERWPLAAPFRIAGYVFEVAEVLVVTLQKDGQIGRGEAAGVYYKNDRPEGMRQQIEAHRERIERGIDHASLSALLPAGGARNALDCALWE